MKKILLCCLCLNLFSLIAMAVPPELQEELNKRGLEYEILCDFDFENTTYEDLKPRWVPIKGKYQVVDGKLEGQQIAEENHVSTSGMDLNIGKHALIYFEVQLHQAKNVIVTLNGKGKGKGHICRLVFNKTFLRVQSDSKPTPVYKTRQQKHSIKKNYKVLIELKDNKLTVRVLNGNNPAPFSIKNDYINWPIDNIRWAVAKGPAKIDQICVAKLK